MRISIELEPSDIRRFLHSLERSRRLARSMDEIDVVNAAKHALDHLPIAAAPQHVRRRMADVQRLIMMVEDDAWALPAPYRQEVLSTLVYFSDPDDMIPDDVEMIGLFDDIIVLELGLRRLRHVLSAYDDFREFREAMRGEVDSKRGRAEYAGRLARRRDALRERMRRQAARGTVKLKGDG